jgi:hypothetical protein
VKSLALPVSSAICGLLLESNNATRAAATRRR